MMTKNKLLTKLILLAVMLVGGASGVWGQTEFVLSKATATEFNGKESDGKAKTFVSGGQTFNIKKGSTEGVAGIGKDGNTLKLSKNATYTITLPTGFTINSINFRGYTNNETEANKIDKVNEIDTNWGNFPLIGVSSSPTSWGDFTASITGDASSYTTVTFHIPDGQQINVVITITGSPAATAPTNLTFNPAEGTIITGKEITLSAIGATSIKWQWGSAAVTDTGDSSWDTAETYSDTNKPIAGEVGTTNNVLSMLASNAIGKTVKSATYTIKASATPHTQTTVDGERTWDWAEQTCNWSSDLNCSEWGEFVMADFDGEVYEQKITFTTDFDATALKVSGQYPFRSNSNKYFQNAKIKLTTTIPGTLEFTFSNTGSKNKGRYVVVTDVKGTQTGEVEADGTTQRTESFDVVAGDITIDGTNNGGIRIYKIVFTPATATVAVTGVTLDKTTAEVEVGKTVTLTATVAPENATNKNVTWESSDETVATVEDGVVTGVAEGTANITVTTVDGNKTATCVVTVVAATPSTGGTAQFKFTKKADWNSSNWQTVDPIKATFTNDAQSDYVKFARGNTLTLEVVGDSYAITNVKLGYVDGNAPKDETITTTVGTMNISGTEWNGVASELVITNSATSSNDARVNMLEVTYVQVIKTTIGSTGWSTFCSDKALDFTGLDVKAYMVTGVNGTKVEKLAVNETVPANTPLLLNGVAAAAYSIPVVESSETSTADNKLVAGTGEDVSAEPGFAKYVMVASEGKAVFKKIVRVPATVPVGKAYLKISEEEGTAPMFSIDGDDDTTGINSVERGALSVEGCYTLDGRRVENPTKGLYIVNGKKVIIK
jgi:uncharacterized protein YjdB